MSDPCVPPQASVLSLAALQSLHPERRDASNASSVLSHSGTGWPDGRSDLRQYALSSLYFSPVLKWTFIFHAWPLGLLCCIFYGDRMDLLKL